MPKWEINITKVQPGIFRTMNGNANEMIAIGRAIKAGFACSKVDITSAKYDAVLEIKDKGKSKLLRIQIKRTSTGSLSFEGGSRSGEQIDRKAEKRNYIYTEKECDIILGIDSNNADCYIISVKDIKGWKKTKKLSELEKYKEN